MTEPAQQKTIVPARKGGRPRLSIRNRRGAKIAKALCKAIELGAPLTVAVTSVGEISYTSFLAWRARENSFDAMVHTAECRRIQKHLSVIEAAAAKGDWRAAAWALEHQNPELFSKHRQQSVVNVVGQINQQFVVPMETLNQIAQARLRYEQEKEG